jgi:hypothetical protein
VCGTTVRKLSSTEAGSALLIKDLGLCVMEGTEAPAEPGTEATARPITLPLCLVRCPYTALCT